MLHRRPGGGCLAVVWARDFWPQMAKFVVLRRKTTAWSAFRFWFWFQSGFSLSLFTWDSQVQPDFLNLFRNNQPHPEPKAGPSRKEGGWILPSAQPGTGTNAKSKGYTKRTLRFRPHPRSLSLSPIPIEPSPTQHIPLSLSLPTLAKRRKGQYPKS